VSLSDWIAAWIRTQVAVWVPVVVNWLASLGVEAPVEPATAVVVAALISGYYTVVRLLEARWPWVGTRSGGRLSRPTRRVRIRRWSACPARDDRVRVASSAGVMWCALPAPCGAGRAPFLFCAPYVYFAGQAVIIFWRAGNGFVYFGKCRTCGVGPWHDCHIEPRWLGDPLFSLEIHHDVP